MNNIFINYILMFNNPIHIHLKDIMFYSYVDKSFIYKYLYKYIHLDKINMLFDLRDYNLNFHIQFIIYLVYILYY